MSNLYVFRGEIVDNHFYLTYVYLYKVLYRLEIISNESLMQMLTEFRPFFV
jgi:hypothetical protein